MANIASARKRIRQTVKRTERNVARRSRMRTFIKKVEAAVETGDSDSAREALRLAQPEIMRAASRGAVHRKTASRKISRLSKRVKSLSVAG